MKNAKREIVQKIVQSEARTRIEKKTDRKVERKIRMVIEKTVIRIETATETKEKTRRTEIVVAKKEKRIGIRTGVAKNEGTRTEMEEIATDPKTRIKERTIETAIKKIKTETRHARKKKNVIKPSRERKKRRSKEIEKKKSQGIRPSPKKKARNKHSLTLCRKSRQRKQKKR